MSFNNSGRPELCIRAGMEEMHKKLQNTKTICGLSDAVVHCVFFTSDKYDYPSEDSDISQEQSDEDYDDMEDCDSKENISAYCRLSCG